MIPGGTAPYKAALAALRNNPAVLLDLNEDVFFETTPMEHLQLLLKFMSGPETVADMISQDEEDPKQPILKNQASGSFVPNVGGLGEVQNMHITPATQKEIISSVLPLQATPHLIERSPKCEFLTPRLFRRTDNARCIWEDFLPSTSDHGAHGLVKNEAKVKDESFDSTIFQNYDERSTRFFYSPTNDITMKAESSVFTTYNGSIGHRRKPITVGKSIPIAFQPTANSLLTAKPRESSKVHKNHGLSSFDVCTTRVYEASKLYTCKTCKRNFKQKCHLYRHQRQHSGVKRFFCIHCSRGFYQRSNLSAHDRTHSNDSSISHRYSCTFCTKRFTRKSSLMKHLVRHSKGLIKMK